MHKYTPIKIGIAWIEAAVQAREEVNKDKYKLFFYVGKANGLGSALHGIDSHLSGQISLLLVSGFEKEAF